jgi:hypothetical protein
MMLMGVGKPAAGGGGCSGWTPATPSGLVGWYKADVGTTGTAPVTAWADQSGNGYTMNPNGFVGPTLNATGLGGKPSLDFTGGFTNGLRTTFQTVAIGTANTASIFMLAKFSATSAGGAYMQGNINSAAPKSDAGSFLFEADGSVPDIYSVHASGTFGTQTASINTEHRLGVILDGASHSTTFVDGASSTVALTSFNFTTPGALSASDGQFDGSIRELIFYNTALGSSDQSCMDAYLVSRQ